MQSVTVDVGCFGCSHQPKPKALLLSHSIHGSNQTGSSRSPITTTEVGPLAVQDLLRHFGALMAASPPKPGQGPLLSNGHASIMQDMSGIPY